MADAFVRIEAIENGSDGVGLALAHNTRSMMSEEVRAYVVHSRTPDNEVFDYGLTAEDVVLEIDYNEARGHKLSHRAIPFKNMIMLFNEEHTIDDLKKLVDEIIDRHPGIRPLHLALHRDEGHYDEDGKWNPNLHAHLIFTSNGQSDNRQYRVGGKTEIRELQDIAAKSLSMKRGVGLYQPGGRMDPALPFSEKKPRLNHWQQRAKMKEEAKAVKKATSAIRKSAEIDVSLLEKKLLAEKEKYKSTRGELVAGGGAKQADYQKLKAAHLAELEALRLAHLEDLEKVLAETSSSELLEIVEKRMIAEPFMVINIKQSLMRLAKLVFGSTIDFVTKKATSKSKPVAKPKVESEPKAPKKPRR